MPYAFVEVSFASRCQKSIWDLSNLRDIYWDVPVLQATGLRPAVLGELPDSPRKVPIVFQRGQKMRLGRRLSAVITWGGQWDILVEMIGSQWRLQGVPRD
jgi:hypothetical protein